MPNSMTSSPRRRRRTALAAVAITLGLTAGCSPITTQMQYNASDGTRVDLGDGVTGTNLLFIAEAAGEPAAFYGAFANNSTKDVVVSFTLSESVTETVELSAGEAVLYSQPGDLTVPDLTASPGDWAQVAVHTASSGALIVNVPVMDTSLPEYAEMAP